MNLLVDGSLLFPVKYSAPTRDSNSEAAWTPAPS